MRNLLAAVALFSVVGLVGCQSSGHKGHDHDHGDAAACCSTTGTCCKTADDAACCGTCKVEGKAEAACCGTCQTK